MNTLPDFGLPALYANPRRVRLWMRIALQVEMTAATQALQRANMTAEEYYLANVVLDLERRIDDLARGS